jgi:O-acetyl-ADP-ribose deacetylase
MITVAVGNTKLSIVRGDITEQDTDAIVNAANSSLMGGGGVDGAIHRKGGPTILEECEQIRKTQWKDGLPIGEAVITSGGKLKARFVIHTVGPVWNGEDKVAKLLTNCYVNCLKLANSRRLNSIAFPAISTGAFGYPIQRAGALALKAAKDFFRNHSDTTLREVVFVLYTSADFEVYKQLFKSRFSYQPKVTDDS